MHWRLKKLELAIFAPPFVYNGVLFLDNSLPWYIKVWESIKTKDWIFTLLLYKINSIYPVSICSST